MGTFEHFLRRDADKEIIGVMVMLEILKNKLREIHLSFVKSIDAIHLEMLDCLNSKEFNHLFIKYKPSEIAGVFICYKCDNKVYMCNSDPYWLNIENRDDYKGCKRLSEFNSLCEK